MITEQSWSDSAVSSFPLSHAEHVPRRGQFFHCLSPASLVEGGELGPLSRVWPRMRALEAFSPHTFMETRQRPCLNKFKI